MSHLTNILRPLLALCLLAAYALPASAQSFLDLDTSKDYRIVNHTRGGTGVAPGALHGSEWVICYLPDGTPTDDCYWTPEFDGPRLALKNSATGQYLSFTPAKDYKTYICVELTDTPTDRSYWTVAYRDGGVTLRQHEDVNYYLLLSTDGRYISAEKGSGHAAGNIFDFVDREGNVAAMPYNTPFVEWIDGLCLDGKHLPYDRLGARFIYPLPGGEVKAIAPRATFSAIDDATYTVTRADGSPLQFSADEVRSGSTIALRRNGEEVATSAIVFTPLPVVEVKAEGTSATEYVYGSVTVCDTDPAVETIYTPTKVRWRGATAINYPKHSYNLKLVDEAHEKRDSTLLGIRSDNAWILDAMAIDRVRMRNRVLFDLWNTFSRTPYDTEFGSRNGTKGRFVEVLLNGDYAGLYCLSDKVDRKLLNLKKVKENADGTVTPRGLLYKSNSWEYTNLRLAYLSDNLDMNSEDWNNWELQYPDDYPSADTWGPLYDLYKFCSDDARFRADYGSRFYIDNVIDFHLFVLAFAMTDNGNKNLFLSRKNITKDDDTRFFITPWDLDTSLGGAYDGRFYGGTYDATLIEEMRINTNQPFDQLWREDLDNYRNAMKLRWDHLRDYYLSAKQVESAMRAYAAEFTATGTWSRELARWEAGTSLVPDLDAEITGIIAWYRDRITQMNEYLAPYASIEAVGSDTAPSRNGVYNLAGVRVADDATALPSLPAGFYIVDGRKVMK